MSLLLLIGIDLTTYLALTPVSMTVSVVGPDLTFGIPPVVKSASYTPIVANDASYAPTVVKTGRAG